MQQNQGGFWGTMWMSAVLFEENNSNMSCVLCVHAFEVLVVLLSLYQCYSRSSVSSFLSIMHAIILNDLSFCLQQRWLQLRSACWCLRTVSRHCLQIWGSLLPRADVTVTVRYKLWLRPHLMSTLSVGQFVLLHVDDISDILHQHCFVSGCLCHGFGLMLQMVYIRWRYLISISRICCLCCS